MGKVKITLQGSAYILNDKGFRQWWEEIHVDDVYRWLAVQIAAGRFAAPTVKLGPVVDF